MPATREPNDQDGAAERDAADWFLQRRRGLSPAERAGFDTWLAASPRHGELLEEMEETWHQLGRAPAEARRPELPRRTGKLLRFGLAFAVAAMLVGGALFAGLRLTHGRNYSESVTTDVGVLRDLELPEHSVVQLSADTLLQVDFTPEVRRISLRRGEANFLVSKHPAWPFLVRADKVEIQAVGTAFDVKIGSDAIDLFVTDGKVQVSGSGPAPERSLLKAPPGSPALLLAGQHLHIPLSGTGGATAPEIFSPEKMNDALAWRNRRLVFHADRLGDIVDEFNRFNRHRLVLASPGLSERRFGGSFPADEYDTLVKTLERDYGISGERLPQETRLSWMAAAAAPPSPAETRLVFKSERLEDIVAEFNRHNRHQLVIDSPELAGLRFGGTFPAGDSETFVAMLERNFQVVATRSPAETRLRAAPPDSTGQKFP